MNTQGYNLFQRIFYIISFVLPLSINSQERLPVPSDTVDIITYRLKGRTASGLYSTKIKEPFVAVSRDLLKKYPLHSYIELYDCKWKGRYKVLDIMNKRHTKTVDIYYNGMKNNLVKCRCRT